VVFGDIHQSVGFARLSYGFKPDAKLGSVVAAKNIEVVNHSVTVESFIAFRIVCFTPFGGRVDSIGLSIKHNLFARANSPNTLGWVWGNREIVSGCDRMGDYFGNGLDSHISRWRLASVNSFEVMNEFLARRLNSEIPRVNTEISPQLVSAGSNHQNECCELQKTDNRYPAAKPYRDLVVERLILAILLRFGGFFLALLGPDKEGRLFGSVSLVGLGLIALGLGCWWTILLPATWGWPL
jgi:hypothetical protein